ncbi:uncharacterized protein LOC142101357 [Mixophyes fleayi]|uniref:uncharacterized protein LOC142101357 n=1 Tax=Mixophyes fleayi TaxID=3061075 RepID=UPI003F4D9D47
MAFYGLLNVCRATCTAAYADKIRYCKTFQKDYIEGIEILIFEERDVGLINSSVFSSSSLKSVLSLTLRGSRIHTIESGAFQQFHGLSNIELQNNTLRTISPSWFHDSATLRNLTMAGNLIRQLRPEMLAGFSGLERLNLSGNEISAIGSDSFRGLYKISSLDLSSNKLFSLQRSALEPLNGTLRLGGNPWNCSCTHREVILLLQELVNTSRLADANLVTCHYPPNLYGALVWNVTDMNCSSSVLSPSPATVHKVVLPALLVLLGILLFSVTMWMMICFLTSHCKNKVTSITDPECRSHKTRPERCAESPRDPRSTFTTRLSDAETGVNRTHPRSVSIQRVFCSHHGNHKAERDLDSFECSEVRAGKSEKRGFPKCLSAPSLEAFGCKRTGDAVSVTEDTIYHSTVTSHGNTAQLSNDCSVHPITPELACNAINSQSFRPAGNSYSVGRELRTDSDINMCDKRDDDHCSETGLLTYFEAYTESLETTLNATNFVEGAIKGDNPSLENDVGFSKVTDSVTLGNKSKTWSTFYEQQDHSVKCHLENKLDHGRAINVFTDNKRSLNREPLEGTCDREELGECSNMTEDKCSTSSISSPNVGTSSERPLPKEGVDVRHIRADFLNGQTQWKSTDHLSECDLQDVQSTRKPPGPSGTRWKDKTKNKEKHSLLHDGIARETFWIYHSNCCDELRPCQTALKVLKQLETCEKGKITEKSTHDPPYDEDLLEENTPYPLLSSKSPESHKLPNPAISSKKTCVSLPDLSLYDNHNANVTCVTPYLIPKEPTITVKDNMDKEDRSKDASLYNLDLPIIDVQAEGLPEDGSRVTEGSPNTLDPASSDVSVGSFGPAENSLPGDLVLPVFDGKTEGLLIAGSRLNNVSPDIQGLPIINVPTGDIGEERLKDVSYSNLVLPVIGFQTECLTSDDSRFKIVLPSNPSLPVIDDVPAEDMVGQENRLEDVLPSNPSLPVIDDVPAEDMVGQENILEDVLPSNPSLPVIDDVPAEDMVGQENRLEDVLPSNPSLPVIDDVPAEDMVGQENRLEDVLPSNPSLPVIDDVPAEDMVRQENRLEDVLPSNPSLPVIDDVPAEDMVRQENRLEDALTSNSDLPLIDVQLECLPRNECRINEVSPYNLSLPDVIAPNESQNVGGGRSTNPEILSSNQTVTAECGPVLSGMFDYENEDTTPNVDSLLLKSHFRELISKHDTGNNPTLIYPTNIRVSSDNTQCETSPHVPAKSLETITNVVSESTSPNNQREISQTSSSNTNLSTETQLTPSASYSNSIQDADEISEWPKNEDILKRTSTISLSSNYNILDNHIIPNLTTDTEHLYGDSSTILHEVHNAENSNNTAVMSIYGHDTKVQEEAGSGLFQLCEQETEDRMSSANNEETISSLQGTVSFQNVNPKECSKMVSDKTLETNNTLKDQPDSNLHIPACTDQTEMLMTYVERQRDEKSHNLVSPGMNNNSADRLDWSDQILAGNLDTTVINDQPEDHVDCHLFVPVIGCEDISKDFYSPLGQPEDSRTNDKTQENGHIQISASTNQEVCSKGLKGSARNLDLSDCSHGVKSDVDIHQADNLIGSKDKLADTASDDPADGHPGSADRLKEENDDLEVSGNLSAKDYGLNEGDTNNIFVFSVNGAVRNDQPGDQANAGAAHQRLMRSKDMSGEKISKKTLCDPNKSERNKTLKISNKLLPPTSEDHKPGLTDYLSDRLSRKQFHSVFEMTASLAGAGGQKTFSTEEEPSILLRPSPLVTDGCTANNPEVVEHTTMDNKEYLSHLYARSPRITMAPGPCGGIGRAEDDMDDISVLANLHFCKVAGSLPVVSKNMDTALDVQEGGVDPTLVPSKPNLIYQPPSKEELKADDELSVLNIMYTLKRSLKLSETYNEESIT